MRKKAFDFWNSARFYTLEPGIASTVVTAFGNVKRPR